MAIKHASPDSVRDIGPAAGDNAPPSMSRFAALIVAAAGTALPLTAGTGAYRTAVLSDAPLAYWEFDESPGATTAADAAPPAQNGTFQNVTLGQPSAFPGLGTAALFNGTSSRVQVAASSAFDLGVGDFSVEAWARTPVTSRGDVFNYKNAQDFGIFFNNSGAGSIGGWHNGALPTFFASLNEWHHVVYVRSAGVIRLYVDGTERGNLADTQSFSAAADLFIGANHGGAPGYAGSLWFNGWIDEVALYPSALTAARVLAHYQAAQPPPEPPALTLLPATDVTATTAVIGVNVTAGTPPPDVTLFWGDDDAGSGGTWDRQLALGALTGSASRTITGLATGTSHHFRARAVNSGGTAWTSAGTFTTSVPSPPVVTALAATGVGGIAATLRAQVIDTGGDPPALTFHLGTADGGTDAAAWQQSLPAGIQSGAVSRLVSPLQPLTTWHFRVSAVNAAGTSWAPATLTFTTPAYTPPRVVINEIHFVEDDATVHSEFIELHNPATEPADLSGAFFDDGINFRLPGGSVIAPGGFLLLCEDPTTVQQKWNRSGPAVISWQDQPAPRWNSLRNGGERLRLRDALGNVIDEVSWGLGFPWPTVGDPPNHSIELINPDLDNDLGGHWRRSDGGASVQQPIVFVPLGSPGWRWRKALSEPSSPVEAWRSVGFAEDATWLTSATGGAPFGYGETVDTLLSDMRQATSPPGYSGIHLRHTFTVSGPLPGPLTLSLFNDDGCIAWINGVEVARFGPASGTFVPWNGVAGRNHEHQVADTVTIQAPNAILNTSGPNVLCIHALNTSLNGSGDFYIDAELHFGGGVSGGGPTPLASNGSLAPNSPPAIRQVNHAPVAPVAGQEWPRSGQEVRVTARITDPDGIGPVSLAYQVVEPGDYIRDTDPRFEAQASWTTIPMNDAGTGGDLIAGDAVYSAIVPASVQQHRRLVRWRLTAADATGLAVRAPYLDDPQPNFAWFVHDGVPAWTGSARPGVSPTVEFPGQLLASVPPYHLITTVGEHAAAQSVPVIRADGSTEPAGAQYGHSLYTWKGALCHRGRVYDHIRFRARGGVWRFSMGKNMWKFDFNKGHDFQAFDNYGRPYDQKWKKLNFSSVIQQGDFLHRGEQGLFESVGFRLFQLTGLEAEHTQFAHFRIVERPSETNGSPSQFDDDFQGLYLAIEQPDGQFLDEHGLPDGNLYKMEGGTGELNNQGPSQPKDKSDLAAFQAYTATESWWRANCNLPAYYNYRAIVDCIHHYDIGDGKNYYFFNNPETGKWQQVAWDLDLTWADNMYRADSGIAGLPPSGNSTEPFFTRVFGNGSSTGIPALRMEHRNRVREIMDLLWNAEQTGLLIDEMASFIFQPGQLSFVDADRAMWDYNPILTSSAVNASKAGHGRFYQRAADAPDGIGNSGPGTPAGSFAGMITTLKNYITTRRNVITAQILTSSEESLAPQTPSVSRTLAGAGTIPADAMDFTSSDFVGRSGATFAAMQWRIAAVTDPAAVGFNPYDRTTPRRYEMEARWVSPELPVFSRTITIPASAARPGELCRVRVRHRDSTGRWSHWSAPLQFTVGIPDVSSYLNALVVSQFMYHPAPPAGAELSVSVDESDYEWIEILNAGPSVLDLREVSFTRGIDFDFRDSAAEFLAPGNRAIVVRNAAAFTARHGTPPPGSVIAGTWRAGANLANGGETLRLDFGSGTAIREFTWSDRAPWPPEADGAGYPLVLIAPWSIPDHSLPQNWRSGTAPGGTPGAYDGRRLAAWLASFGLTDPGSDDDDDGLTNLAEYALGGHPLQPSPAHLPSAEMATIDAGVGPQRFALISAIIPAGHDDALLEAQSTRDLTSWLPDMVRMESVPLPGGMRRERWRSSTPWDADRKAFFRLRIGLRP